jgi:TrmH family RNA methyltransferase
MQTITSRHNPLYRTLQTFKKDKGIMLLEGRRLVEDAFSRGMSPRILAVTPDYLDEQGPPVAEHIILSPNLFAGIAETETPQGILAFFDTPWSDIRKIMDQDRVIILDSLQDPGNVGTIIRTAEAFGFSGMILFGNVANPFSPKVIRSSMGSCLGISIARGSINDLKALPHRILALVPQGRTRLSAGLFKPKVALCLGQESEGISPEVLELSRDTVFIPMEGRTESLNVAVAAGIVMACSSGLLGV